ncbi:hypothetical protein V8C42DRAFT_358447 [Trichoderma barbatum]
MTDTPRLMPQEMADDLPPMPSLPESVLFDGQAEYHGMPVPPPFTPGEHPNPLGSCPPNPPMALGAGSLRKPENFPRPSQGMQESTWDLPGVETAPAGNSDRHITGHWMAGEFLLIYVGGKSFRVPMRLLAKDPFWASLSFLEQPPQGWSMPGIDADNFAVLMECVYSTSGLQGTEGGLNLVKICFAYLLAWKWSMAEDRRKLRDTIYRYIVRKVLHHSPYHPRSQAVLDVDHFVYRSEELYRTWELAQQHPCLQKILNQGDLVSLYAIVVPEDLWTALNAHFTYDFRMQIDIAAASRTGSDEVNFQNWWLRFFRLAGYTEASWLTTEAADRTFGPMHEDGDGQPIPMQDGREFAAARARSNALVNELEVRLDQEPTPAPTSPTDLDGDVDAEGEVITEEDIDAEGDMIVEEDVDASPIEDPTPSRPPQARQVTRVRFANEPEIFTFNSEDEQDHFMIPYEDIPDQNTAGAAAEEAQVTEDVHFEV